jgi:aspartate 1-decarboxylase
MTRSFLNSKIHKGTITGTKILTFEKIDIYNITNGERLTTYAIAGPADSGEICANGACCHKINKHDEVIICSYIELLKNEIDNHRPTILHLNTNNEIVDKINNKIKIV